MGGIAEEVLSVERVRAQRDAEAARLLYRFDMSGEWSLDGSRSCAAFLQRHLRCSEREAHRRVRVARQVHHLEETARAWAEGVITTEHVDVIARARHRARDDLRFDAFEPWLVELARVGTPEDLARVVRQWQDALDADRGTTPDGQAELRRFDFARSISGMGFGSLTLDAVGAEFVETALDTAYEEMHVAADPRTPAQQRADALVEISRSFLESRPASRANLPNVLMLTDDATVDGDSVGECRLASGARVSPETARRLLCDASIQRVYLGEDGVPLALGRAMRTFTPDQFRFLVARDGHCRGPACRVSPARCEAHHLKQWARDGGSTDVNNGALFCRGHCHRMLHEGGWTVRGHPSGKLEFYDLEGLHIGSSSPAVRVEPILTRRGRRKATLDELARTRARELVLVGAPKNVMSYGTNEGPVTPGE